MHAGEYTELWGGVGQTSVCAGLQPGSCPQQMHRGGARAEARGRLKPAPRDKYITAQLNFHGIRSSESNRRNSLRGLDHDRGREALRSPRRSAAPIRLEWLSHRRGIRNTVPSALAARRSSGKSEEAADPRGQRPALHIGFDAGRDHVPQLALTPQHLGADLVG